MIASTLRMPEELRQRLREWAREEGRSLNDLVVKVLERELRRREGMRAIEEAIRFGDAMAGKYGPMPDSTEEIRRLREERAGLV